MTALDRAFAEVASLGSGKTQQKKKYPLANSMPASTQSNGCMCMHTLEQRHAHASLGEQSWGLD